MGRPRLVGQRLPQLDQVLFDPQTVWQKAWVTWYGQGQRRIEWCSGTALWYRGGQTPLPIRWVLTRDPEGKRDPRAYFSTDQAQTGLSIITDFMKRWCAEVTFEESRAYLGVETQRQWSERLCAKASQAARACAVGLLMVSGALASRLSMSRIMAI